MESLELGSDAAAVALWLLFTEFLVEPFWVCDV